MGKCFIVAEMSANHGGDKSVAIETIRAAKRAGADAIKLQTYTADTITLDCDKPDFVINEGSIWDGRKFYELYQKAYTPWEWHEELFQVAHDEGFMTRAWYVSHLPLIRLRLTSLSRSTHLCIRLHRLRLRIFR